jgi:hypothetical protein
MWYMLRKKYEFQNYKNLNQQTIMYFWIIRFESYFQNFLFQSFFIELMFFLS